MCVHVWSGSHLSLDPDPICDLSLGLYLSSVFFLQFLTPSLMLLVTTVMFLSDV